MIFHGPKRTTCDNCKRFYVYLKFGGQCPYFPCKGSCWTPDRKVTKKPKKHVYSSVGLERNATNVEAPGSSPGRRTNLHNMRP